MSEVVLVISRGETDKAYWDEWWLREPDGAITIEHHVAAWCWAATVLCDNEIEAQAEYERANT